MSTLSIHLNINYNRTIVVSGEIMPAYECSHHSERLKTNCQPSITNALVSKRANNDAAGAF